MSASDGPSDTSLRRLAPSHYVEFSRLGEGSMGLVYLALDTELNRRVAFKMIRPLAEAEDTEPLEATPSPEDESFPEMKARFLQEAWVTGGLEHPGIVPVYELGETTGGIPYYTMRVVRGEKTLADAIEQAQGLDGRLALLEPFLKICDTVRYAHARGVIHRDLKPANIALGDYGETVVLDWGLAKLKDRPDLARSVWQARIEELRSETDLQTLASAIGTPGYMSPEAALVRVEDVDARSDVYSLGAILYRILTGRLPFEFRDYGEFVRKLTTEAPQDPSEIDAAVPAGLSRICLKALSAEREARYADADEVAAAIRAWQRESALEREVAVLLREAESALETAPNLQGEALLRQVDRVTAVCARILDLRPGDARAEALQSKGHQLRERAIVERERGARKRLLKRVAVVGLATATAATVIVALLLDTKRREAEEARTREAQARTRAEEERLRAEDLATFMLGDLRDGLKPLGRLDLLGKVALKSKEYYESLQEELDDDTLHRRCTALQNVGSVLEEQGDLTGAMECYRESLAIMRRLVERNPTKTTWRRHLLISLRTVGCVLQKQGNLKGALESFRESLIIRRRLAAQDPTNATWQSDLSITLHNIGVVLVARADLGGALENLRESEAIGRRLATQDPTNTTYLRELSLTLVIIGDVLRARGNLEGALEVFRESLAIRSGLAAQDPTHATLQYECLIALNRVGGVLLAQGDLEGALKILHESLAIERRLAAQDPTNATWQRDLAVTLEKVGAVLKAGGDLEGALESHRESLAIRRRLVEQDPTNSICRADLSVGLQHVGSALRALGNLDGALESLRESLTIARRLAEQDPTNVPSQSHVSFTLINIGNVLEDRRDLGGALDSYRDAQAILRRLSEQDPTNATWQRTLSVNLANIGDVLGARGDLGTALEKYREALEIVRRLEEQDPTNATWQRDLSLTLNKIGAVLEGQGNLAEALQIYAEIVATRRRLVEQDPTNAGRQRGLSLSLYALGNALDAHGDLKDAVKVFREARDVHKRAVDLSPHLANEHPYWESRYRGVALLAGEQSPRTAADHLALAYAFSGRKAFLSSAQSFATALEDESIRANLQQANLYNAACSASLASASSKGEEAAKWHSQALDWLAEDLRLRRELLGRVEAELAEKTAPKRSTELQRVRSALCANFEHARVRDPDLASLRGTPEFEALFKDLPKGEGDD